MFEVLPLVILFVLQSVAIMVAMYDVEEMNTTTTCLEENNVLPGQKVYAR